METKQTFPGLAVVEEAHAQVDSEIEIPTGITVVGTMAGALDTTVYEHNYPEADALLKAKLRNQLSAGQFDSGSGFIQVTDVEFVRFDTIIRVEIY